MFSGDQTHITSCVVTSFIIVDSSCLVLSFRHSVCVCSINVVNIDCRVGLSSHSCLSKTKTLTTALEVSNNTTRCFGGQLSNVPAVKRLVAVSMDTSGIDDVRRDFRLDRSRRILGVVTDEDDDDEDDGADAEDIFLK
jgi:hypothetical protein